MAGDGAPQCKLMEGLFADFVQLVLGVVAVSILVYKRYRERPRRPWRIWFMDVSKQGLGALFAHVLNIMLSTALSWNSTCTDECAWYAVNFFIDVTVGVALNILMLNMLRSCAYRCDWNALKISGDYGRPPRVRIWLLQLTSWLLIVFTAKAVLGVVLFTLSAQVSEVGCWLLAPIADNPKLELVVVMVLGPYFMNACQFWILDNFLKKNVTPHALHEVRSAIDRRNGTRLGGGNSPSQPVEIAMSSQASRHANDRLARDDERLLLSSTPPDVEADLSMLMAAGPDRRDSLSSAGDFTPPVTGLPHTD